MRIGLWLICGLACCSPAFSQEADATQPPAFSLEADFQSLFNGRDFSGWKSSGKGLEASWRVAEGELICTGKSGPWLRSEREYGDFELRLEYQVKAAGNSGVYVRVPENGTHHGENAGLEVQILDDHSPKLKNSKPYQFAGSLYAIVPAAPRVAKPTGEWNTLQIRCEGTHYTVTHNGVVVVDTDGVKTPELAKRRAAGFLGLQNHNKEVHFRHMRIQSLNTQ